MSACTHPTSLHNITTVFPGPVQVWLVHAPLPTWVTEEKWVGWLYCPRSMHNVASFIWYTCVSTNWNLILLVLDTEIATETGNTYLCCHI